MNTAERLQECAIARKVLELKIVEQHRIIDDQCDTIVDLVEKLDARDVN